MGLKTRTMRVEDVKLDPSNARRHPSRNLAEIKKSLKRFGQQKPIVIDAGGVVRAGNGTLLAAKALGWESIEVVESGLTDKELTAFAVADNRTAELAEWDADVLAELLRDPEIGDIGFTDVEVAEVLAESTSDEDRLAEEPTVPSIADAPRRTAKGDVWAMGEHRLLCGDSTEASNLLRLVGSEQASMVFTDPPYNVAYEGKTKDALTIQNDSMSASAFRAFLLNAFTAAFEASKDGAPIYICHADCEMMNFLAAMQESGWLFKQCLIWVKNTLILGRRDYQFQHEPILYGWKPGKHKWYGGRKKTTVIEMPGIGVEDVDGGHQLTVQTEGGTLVIKVPSFEVLHEGLDTSVIRIDKPPRNAEHPTMKPIALPGRAIKNSSKPGDIILDPFFGSGSTLIAAELLDRRCYGLEIDPVYCDVILARWEAQSGKQAERLEQQAE